MLTNKFIAVACLQPEIGKVPFKVTRQSYIIGLCCIEFPDPKNHGNKEKVHQSSLPTTRDKNHVIGVITSYCQIVT